MNHWKKRILIIVLAILLNLLGRYPALYFGAPAYLNLCGTILAAYFEGPVVGSVAAVLGCALSSFFNPGDWYYLIADVAVAVAVGLLAKKNKFFDKFALIFSATAFFAVVRAPILLMINLSLNEGKSGLYVADAIVDYMVSVHSPLWLGYVTMAICVSFTDTFMAVFLLYFVMRIRKSFGKRRKASALKKELRKKVTLGVLLAVALASVFGPTQSRADNSIGFKSLAATVFVFLLKHTYLTIQ